MTAQRLGFIMFAVMVTALLALPWVLDTHANQQSLRAAFAAPSGEYLLGADQFGRSILARLVEGGRYSLAIALTIVALCMATGAFLASLAAWLGGAWDSAITAFADGVYAIPGLLLVLVIAGLFGGSIIVLVTALWFASWPEYYRLSRGVVRRVAASDHVLASRLIGMPVLPVIWYQVLPQALPYLAGIGSLALGRTILAIASLGFLGIGIMAPQAEWGAMVSGLLPYAERALPQLIAPVLAIVWTVTATLLVGQGLTGRVIESAYHDA